MNHESVGKYPSPLLLLEQQIKLKLMTLNNPKPFYICIYICITNKLGSTTWALEKDLSYLAICNTFGLVHRNHLQIYHRPARSVRYFPVPPYIFLDSDLMVNH